MSLVLPCTLFAPASASATDFSDQSSSFSEFPPRSYDVIGTYFTHSAESQNITLPFLLAGKGYALLCVGFPTSDFEVELSAQNNSSGIPQQFLDARDELKQRIKKLKQRRERKKQEKMANEIGRRN